MKNVLISLLFCIFSFIINFSNQTIFSFEVLILLLITLILVLILSNQLLNNNIHSKKSDHKKKPSWIVFILSGVVFGFIINFFVCELQRSNNLKKANNLIVKIEESKKQNGQYPIDLKSIIEAHPKVKLHTYLGFNSFEIEYKLRDGIFFLDYKINFNNEYNTFSSQTKKWKIFRNEEWAIT